MIFPKEGHHALGRNCTLILGQRISNHDLALHRAGSGQDSARSDLDRHELHDGLQFASRDLPDDVPRPRYAADRRRHDRQQPHPKHFLSAQLHDPADKLSKSLRANFAFAIARTGRAGGSAQIGNGFGNRVDRLFGRGTADRDGLRCAVKIQPADMSDPRRNVHVRRVAGQSHAGEPVLHDVE